MMAPAAIKKATSKNGKRRCPADVIGNVHISITYSYALKLPMPIAMRGFTVVVRSMP